MLQCRCRARAVFRENNRHSPKGPFSMPLRRGSQSPTLEETSDDNWRQRARINIRVRVKPQVLERLLRSGDKSAKRAERLRKGAVDERDAVLHFELFSGAATVFATAENRVRFVNENTCAMRLGDVG